VERDVAFKFWLASTCFPVIALARKTLLQFILGGVVPDCVFLLRLLAGWEVEADRAGRHASHDTPSISGSINGMLLTREQ
jgi:hypothetical protein